MAILLIAYEGAEVTIGGWIVTFIRNERNGGPDAGYISSGFFGGLMIGRLALIGVSKLVRHSKSIPLCSFLLLITDYVFIYLFFRLVNIE